MDSRTVRSTGHTQSTHTLSTTGVLFLKEGWFAGFLLFFDALFPRAAVLLCLLSKFLEPVGACPLWASAVSGPPGGYFGHSLSLGLFCLGALRAPDVSASSRLYVHLLWALCGVPQGLWESVLRWPTRRAGVSLSFSAAGEKTPAQDEGLTVEEQLDLIDGGLTINKWVGTASCVRAGLGVLGGAHSPCIDAPSAWSNKPEPSTLKLTQQDTRRVIIRASGQDRQEAGVAS